MNNATGTGRHPIRAGHGSMELCLGMWCTSGDIRLPLGEGVTAIGLGRGDSVGYQQNMRQGVAPIHFNTYNTSAIVIGILDYKVLYL